MFSIVIPLYNKELSVKNTIESVLNQTISNFEIVIVNDGSTDNSVQVVEQIADSRIRIIHQKNQGVSAARNRGIEEAIYDWIAFLDADDLWKQNHLEEIVNMINIFPKDRVFCTTHNKSKLKTIYKPNICDGYEIIEDYFSIVMKNVDFFWTGAVCIHKTVFDTSGTFPVSINRGEDLYVWSKIGKNFRIIRSSKNTVSYNINSENKLTKNRSRYKDSIISIINLDGLKGSERKYFKHLLLVRIKLNFKRFDILENFNILIKYNVKLLF